MHPAHIPLHAETQPANVGRPRDHWPRGRLFRDGLDSRMLFVSLGVELAQKINGFEILTSTKFVRNPLASLARVVEIKHGSDRIYYQAIDVIFIQPEQATGHKKAAHFVATVVEDESLPVGMKTLAGIGVLVQMCAIEVGQPVRVS